MSRVRERDIKATVEWDRWREIGGMLNGDAQAWGIRVELPEVDKDDMKIMINKGMVTLKGERKRPELPRH